LFTQSLSLCAQAGLVSLGRVALDGTKVRAAASRHRAMSYDRMVRAESELAGEVMNCRSSWPAGGPVGRDPGGEGCPGG
jgi:hypothetical protein